MQKLLFWVDSNLIQLFIAKIMKEQNQFELHAIFDHDSLDKTLYNQDTIFKNKWFFWDYVKKDYKPDLKYLKKFEEKYKIDLWRIIIPERVFFNNYYHKFSKTEILGIIEQECKFFEKLLDQVNPDFLIMRMYDLHRLVLLKDMCIARGINVLMIQNTRVAKRVIISSSGTKFDNIEGNVNISSNTNFKQSVEFFKNNNKSLQFKKVKGGGVDSSLLLKIKSIIIFFLDVFDKNYTKSYDHYGMSLGKILIFRIKKIFQSKFRKRFLDSHSFIPQNIDEKFIYFPLHVQPERTIDVDADFYQDQISLVEKIAKSVPIEYVLYVKENPNMRFRNWRKIEEYKRILNLPNVRLVHYLANPLDLISKSSLVITIAGSAGQEAALYEKPSIVFSDVNYEWLSSVTKIKNLEKLPEEIKKSLNTNVEKQELEKLYEFYKLNTFEFDSTDLDNKILDRFHNEGYLPKDNILVKELDLFLEENRQIFVQLTEEYVKKIIWWNKK